MEVCVKDIKYWGKKTPNKQKTGIFVLFCFFKTSQHLKTIF